MIIHTLVNDLFAAVHHLAPTVPPVPGGGINAPPTATPMDFNPPAGDAGITKLNIWRVLASVIKYVGYGLTFLAFLCGIVVWGFGHYFLGQQSVTHAKQVILRAGTAAVLLGLAGTIWQFLIS